VAPDCDRALPCFAVTDTEPTVWKMFESWLEFAAFSNRRASFNIPSRMLGSGVQLSTLLVITRINFAFA